MRFQVDCSQHLVSVIDECRGTKEKDAIVALVHGHGIIQVKGNAVHLDIQSATHVERLAHVRAIQRDRKYALAIIACFQSGNPIGDAPSVPRRRSHLDLTVGFEERPLTNVSPVKREGTRKKQEEATHLVKL